MIDHNTPDADVIVIGGGLAGLPAAREVEAAGLTTVVLEASGRIGGRLHARPYKDTHHELEFGGNAYSREYQPLTVAEYERYALAEVGTPETGTFVQLLDGAVHRGAAPVPEHEFAALERGLLHWMAGVRRINFDGPFDEQGLEDLDVSISDYFAPLDLPKATLDHLYSWSIHCNGEDPDRVSALHMMRWFASLGYSAWNYYAKADRKWPTSAEYIAKLGADIAGEIRLGSPVAGVESLDGSVTVTTAVGETMTGRTAIVATGLNAWRTMTFSPSLGGGKARAAKEGQIGTNKIFVRVRNAPAGIFATSWEAGIGVAMMNNALPDGSQILVVFVNSRRLDTSDPKAVEDALRTVIPEIEVASVDEEDWRENDYRGGGLLAFTPGQLTSFDSDLRTPEGRVFFATSDISQKWGGWIEGALETAVDAAHSAVALVTAGAPLVRG